MIQTQRVGSIDIDHSGSMKSIKKEPEKPKKQFTRDDFEYEFKTLNTVVDTFLMIAPDDEKFMVDLAKGLG